MNINLAIHLVQEDVNRYLDNWTVICEKTNKIAGCEESTKRIILSSDYIVLNVKERVEIWGRHEIAHALVGYDHHHDKIWQKQAILLGVPPIPYDPHTIHPEKKYKAICPKCSCVYQRDRVSLKFKYFCRYCGEAGKLEYSTEDASD